jgi:hypothetical protein
MDYNHWAYSEAPVSEMSEANSRNSYKCSVTNQPQLRLRSAIWNIANYTHVSHPRL